MKQTLRISAVCALTLALAMSTFAQQRPNVGTVVDIDEGRNRLQIELDDAAQSRVTIEADAISTTYHGFGSMIAGKPEIFTGSAGFSNLRLGDRLEVRGSQRAEGIFKADRVTLLGRTVQASPTGVGQTRDPERGVATPTDDRATGAVTAAANRVEGIVRRINDEEGRLVIQTTDRRMINVRTYRNTPVYYRGEQYRVSNLEVGDRVRIDADTRTNDRDEISARRIDVVQSVQEQETSGTSATVTILEGRVVRVDPGLDYAYVNDGRGEIRVDMQDAEDDNGDLMRARDLQIGDRVEITGSYNRVGDMFLASTVRMAGATGERDEREEPFTRYSLVTFSGTITATLEDGATITLRDRDTNRVERIWVSDDFVVSTSKGSHITAGALRANDTAVITAFRDGYGTLIAQTIRLRNR
jgi:hypothetical protein